MKTHWSVKFSNDFRRIFGNSPDSAEGAHARSAKLALRPRRYCRLEAEPSQQVGLRGKDVRAFVVFRTRGGR